MSSIKGKGREPIYEVNLKIAVAREYLTGNLGYGGLAKKYDLKLDTVRFFVKWYRLQYGQIAIANQQIKEAEDNNGEQHDELKLANLKITALEMLIENAGKELGVDLVKKFGTKQLKK